MINADTCLIYFKTLILIQILHNDLPLQNKKTQQPEMEGKLIEARQRN